MSLLSFLDRFVIEHIGSTSRSKDGSPITWLAVFDGHGGAAASQFCSDWLSSYVRKNEFFPNQLPLAMQTAFTKVWEKDLFPKVSAECYLFYSRYSRTVTIPSFFPRLTATSLAPAI
jgi:hypothetical protein